MSKGVVLVEVRSVLPCKSGRAVFLGTAEKVFLIYVDEAVGVSLTMALNQAPRERPLTHDLMHYLLLGLGAKVERVVIHDVKSETFYARLIVSCENEVQEKKVLELDARPSDCMVLAVMQGAPIFVSNSVWDEVEDRSEELRQIEESIEREGDDGGGSEDLES